MKHRNEFITKRDTLVNGCQNTQQHSEKAQSTYLHKHVLVAKTAANKLNEEIVFGHKIDGEKLHRKNLAAIINKK